ncbi:MAG: hypothetical protein AB9879_12390 [Methanothrix sp.]
MHARYASFLTLEIPLSIGQQRSIPTLRWPTNGQPASTELPMSVARSACPATVRPRSTGCRK